MLGHTSSAGINWQSYIDFEDDAPVQLQVGRLDAEIDG